MLLVKLVQYSGFLEVFNDNKYGSFLKLLNGLGYKETEPHVKSHCILFGWMQSSLGILLVVFDVRTWEIGILHFDYDTSGLYRSSRESYGDDAVGYVQLHWEHEICTVKCKIYPEHKARSNNITMMVNETNGEIISCKCHDCVASAGGCKHVVAFLMWAHRRSEEPPCTSVECYWKKPILSRVGTTLKYITVTQLYKKEVPHRPSSSVVYDDFISKAKKKKIDTCELRKYQHDFKHTYWCYAVLPAHFHDKSISRN